MRGILFSLIICLVLLSVQLRGDFSKDAYDSLYEEIKTINLDFESTFDLNNFEFIWDAANFNFASGQGILLEGMNGKRLGFYFEGEGKIQLKAPTPVEMFSIKKFTKDEVFEHEFKKALFIYSPDVHDSVFSGLALHAGPEKGGQKSDLKNYINELLDFGLDMPAEMIPRLLSSAESPFVLSIVKAKRKTYYFLYDPTQTESVQIFQEKQLYGFNMLQTITSFFPRSHYETSEEPYERDQVEFVAPIHYDINTTIEKNTDIHSNCALTLRANTDSLWGLFFSHTYELEMDSIKRSDGTDLFFSKLKDYGTTRVMFDRPLMIDDTVTIIFHYHSKDIIKKSAWGDFYNRAPASWYPRIGYLLPATYRLAFQTPEWLTFLCVGDKITDTVSGDWRYTEWISTRPIYMVSFNYGLFDSLTLSEPNLPTIKVYRSDAAHVGRLFGSDMLEVTGGDVQAALEFCSANFCSYPFREMVVTEIPYFARGQSFPGFLHLGWLSFEEDFNTKRDQADAFRAHETSHQWWGHIVGWKSYHDQWLSEGFAEYTSAWFMQTRDGDNKRFLDMLDAWKDQITQKGGGSGRYWQEGSAAGPIWLGYRLSSTKSNDYFSLVYAKGGYVIHMLRMILFDFNNNSNDRFIELMRDFVRTYSGKKASTEDFKNLTEKHLGMDMDWFFDQWVFGIDIPTYRNEYEVIEENGQYIIKAHIKQENVPDDFKMVVPLVVEFENKSHTVLKFWVEGPETEYISKPLPYKPKKFIFNPYKAVLCHEK
jgi:hypothetical protein